MKLDAEHIRFVLDWPTLADYIQGILSRKAQAGKSGYSPSLYNLKDGAMG